MIVTKGSSYKLTIIVGVFFLGLFFGASLYAQSAPREWKTYRRQKLNFSFSYPSDLKTHDWPDGASVLADPNTFVRDLFFVSNNAFQFGYSDYAKTPGRFFRRLRSAKPGQVTKGDGETLRKIRDLAIDGFPAVEVESVFVQLQENSVRQVPSNIVECKRPAPYSFIVVYVMRGNHYWQMQITELFTKSVNPEARRSFEQIVKTFRFR